MKVKTVLNRKRILVCGKGGSGKSTIAALMGRVLEKSGYEVVVLDGDASNPVGLTALFFGKKESPRPLLEFFGGREHVTCPVDDPSPLTRVNDTVPVTEKHLCIDEIPEDFVIKKNKLYFFQAGKTKQVFEGCDGPTSKISRDFFLDGDHVTIIDVEAGIEHFGRGIDKNMDIIICVVDPNYESVLIAEAVKKYCGDLGIKHCFALLNKTEAKDVEKALKKRLRQREIEILGTLRFDPRIFKSGLKQTAIKDGSSVEEMYTLVKKLEKNCLNRV